MHHLGRTHAHAPTVKRRQGSMQGNSSGIFATHQHALFAPALGLLPQLRRCKLAHMPPPEEADGTPAAAAFMLRAGESRDSLAFSVAASQVRSSRLSPMLLLSLNALHHWMRRLPSRFAHVHTFSCHSVTT